MNEFILNVFETKFVGTEPDKSLLINEDSQWLHIGNEYIYPKIPLISSNKVRVGYVPLDNALLLKIM
jgi:hypothetical protein